MSFVIACRIASYGEYQERAWSHLPELGIRNVELPVPAVGELEAVRKRLADHGLSATSLQARFDVAGADAVDVMKPQLEACAALGAKICFSSVKAGDLDREMVWQRLRQIGDVAGGLGVTLALETHPDLMTNGDVARESITAINHAHVKVNFDTANIYFYNQGCTAVGELEKIIDHVAALHLKDTAGGYQDWNFPALGTGVVDFPKVFEMLRKAGFNGPCTMELEGTRGVELTEAQQLQYVADSVAYLKKIGVLGG